MTPRRPVETEPWSAVKVGPVAGLLVLAVRGYRRLLSPLFPPHCRFAPSCSRYALEALQTHGALRGSWLSVRRLSRCHPFTPGGHDPVPPRRTRAADAGRSDDGSCAASAPAHRTAGHRAGATAARPAPDLSDLPLGARS